MKQSKKSSGEKTPEQLDAELYHDLRVMKKQLKQCSKNQLINLVFDQMNRFMEQRQANEALLDKNAELMAMLEKVGETHDQNS